MSLTCPRQMSQLNHGHALWFVAPFPLCIPPECMWLLGSLPHSLTSSVFNPEMWDMFARAVSIYCFPLAARWRVGCWVPTSLTLSNN